MSGMDRKKDIIICDLDGTLANDDHRSHLIKLDNPNRSDNWDKYFELCSGDTPVYEVCNLVRRLNNFYDVHIFSGRSDKVKEKTELWLSKHMIPYDVLRMRPGESRDQDHIMKIEWANPIRDRVAFILEDRQRVVDAWRAAGYICLQVALGNF